MPGNPSPTADVPIPEKHIAEVADSHDVAEDELREALAFTYADLAEGADAIHEHQASDEVPLNATDAAEGLASVIHVDAETWEQPTRDLPAKLREAVKTVHARFASALETPAADTGDREPLVMPSERIGALVRAGLSRRQAQVQVLDDVGLSTAAIAERLGVAESTVKVHRHRIGVKVDEAEQLLAIVGE